MTFICPVTAMMLRNLLTLPMASSRMVAMIAAVRVRGRALEARGQLELADEALRSLGSA